MMENTEVTTMPARLSVENVIDLIRTIRNDLIKDFLVDENLRAYFTDQFGKELSVVRKEFLKRELQDLLITPVDLSHYSSLIKQIRETGSASLVNGNQELFYQELEDIFRKYSY